MRAVGPPDRVLFRKNKTHDRLHPGEWELAQLQKPRATVVSMPLKQVWSMAHEYSPYEVRLEAISTLSNTGLLLRKLHLDKLHKMGNYIVNNMALECWQNRASHI